MKAIELVGKLKAVKIKPDCGELETAEATAIESDYKLIARIVTTGEPILVTLKTPGGSGLVDEIVTSGTVKKATIEVDGCNLKYDGLQFTQEQYATLAGMVQSNCTVLFSLAPAQGEFDFDESENDK